MVNMQKEENSKRNKEVIDAYQKILTKNIYLLVFSVFFVIFTAPLVISDIGRRIWGILMFGIILYNSYFTFRVNRCPSCNKRFPNYCFNLEKCPYCGIRLRE